MPHHQFTPEEASTAARMGAAVRRMKNRERLARHAHPFACPYCNETLPRPDSTSATCPHCHTVIATGSVVRDAGRRFPNLRHAVKIAVVFLVLLTSLAQAQPVSDPYTFVPASTPIRGTEATQGILDGQAITFAKTAQTVSNTSTSSTWTAGGVTARITTRTSATGLTFAFTIVNGYTGRLESIDFRLTELTTPFDVANRVQSPFRGGQVREWEHLDWQNGMGNSALWPGPAFSPIVTLWNDRDTLALTYFNKSLTPVMAYWFSGPGAGNTHCFNPFLRYLPNLQPGQTLEVSADFRIMTGGPTAHQKYYRQYRLAPFMKSLGIQEAIGSLEPGAIAAEPWVDPGKMLPTLQAAAKAGASAYFQWAPPDGRSTYYNPNPSQLAWFDDLPASKQVPGLPVGVLINPFMSPPLPADKIALLNPTGPDINLRLNLGDPGVRLYVSRLRDALVARGVSLAFWDSGGCPDGDGFEWLRILADWKRAGIAIMPETSCDVAAWTTGLWMEFPYSWSDYSLQRVVTPQADLAAAHNSEEGRAGITWEADAKAKGVRPIIGVQAIGGGK